MCFVHPHFPSPEFSNFGDQKSEVSKKGLAGGGWRLTAPKTQQNLSPELCSLTHKGNRKKLQRKGLNRRYGRDILAPTPLSANPFSKPLKNKTINNFGGFSGKGWGSKFTCSCVAMRSLGEKETCKQNSRKSQKKAGTVPK